MSAQQPSPWWRTLGIALVVLVAIAGLAVFAFIIFVFVAMGSFGSNK
jgi:hypothetical protein